MGDRSRRTRDLIPSAYVAERRFGGDDVCERQLPFYNELLGLRDEGHVVLAWETGWDFVALKDQREVSADGSDVACDNLLAKYIDLSVVFGRTRLQVSQLGFEARPHLEQSGTFFLLGNRVRPQLLIMGNEGGFALFHPFRVSARD